MCRQRNYNTTDLQIDVIYNAFIYEVLIQTKIVQYYDDQQIKKLVKSKIYFVVRKQLETSYYQVINKIRMEIGHLKNIHGFISLDQEIPIVLHDHSRSVIPQQHAKQSRTIESVRLQELSEKFQNNERPGNNVSFSIPKQKILGNKRIIVPKKVSCKERSSSSEKSSLFQNGQMRALNQYLAKEKHCFSVALKQEQEVRCPDTTLSKRSERVHIYQSLRKKDAISYNDKLKPITMAPQVISEGSSLFSVQRVNDSDKKCKNSIINLNAQSIGNSESISKYDKKVKLLNFAKGRLNIQRIVSLNEQFKFREDNKLRNIITIFPLTPCTQFEKIQNILKRQINSSKMLAEVGHINEIFNPNINKQQEVQQRKKTNQEPLIDLAPRNIQVSKPKTSQIQRSNKKFNVPFPTYYYRDLLWKANFTNSLYIEVPMQYEHRLKVYVGKGNNSCMVSSLISRRPWYAFTDKVQQANFFWSQTKILNYFKNQASAAKQTNPQPLQVAKYKQKSILTEYDEKQYKKYFNTYFKSEQRNDQRLLSRANLFKFKKIIKVNEIKETKMHNHLINNYVIGNKKALFNTMSNYYKDMNLNVFDFLPLTFHIKDGLQDTKYFQFLRYYHKRAKEINKNNEDKTKTKQYNAWIVKPGENSNRGNGITMCLTLQDIKKVLKQRERYSDGTYRTYIVQAYIQRPLLYYKRKFDIRHYMMITSINGYIKGYWYKDGYVRTTSSEYSLLESKGSIHLTNDAVQKNLPDYGKYEKGNKISYDQLASYIEKFHSKKGKNFYEHIYPKMQRIATDAIRACSGGIDPSKLSNNFQIFGLDFMIDINLDVWLIQINTNPCLELSCPLLSSIIPKFIENTLELTLDCMFPPPVRYTPKGVHYFKQLEKENRFSLVYDERFQKLYDRCLEVLDNKLLEQQDDVFQDCGDQWQDN